MSTPRTRTHAVATLTDNAVTGPVLTVTVRAAFFVPTRYLPPMMTLPAPPARGCETWRLSDDLHPVLGVTFAISTRPVDGSPVELQTIDGVVTKRAHDGEGVASEVVIWTDLAERSPTAPPARTSGNQHVGEAKLSLAGLSKGDWVLKLSPREDAGDNQLTSPPDRSAGPETRIPVMPGDAASRTNTRGSRAAGDSRRRTFRPLLVLLTLDDALELVSAETCCLDDQGRMSRQAIVSLPDGEGKTRQVRRDITHGYVTAFVADQLAIDMKPDVIRSQIWGRFPRAGQAIDMIVLHNTAAADPASEVVMGGAINFATPLKTPTADNPHGYPYGSHYYVDRDGHVVKFLDDGEISLHTDRTHFYFVEKEKWADNKWLDLPRYAPNAIAGGNNRAIGIDLVIKPGDSCTPPQLQALLDLLSRVKGTYGVKAHRIVGHCDVKVEGLDAAPDMGDRWNCPGVGFQWPVLEQAGFGWATSAKELGPGDYCGFFTLTDEEIAPLGKTGSAAQPLAIRKGDDDDARTWSGIEWNSPGAKQFLERRSQPVPSVLEATPFNLKPPPEKCFPGLALKDIVRLLQHDLRDIGYSVSDNGKMDDRTARAVYHFMAHTFAGPRQPDPPPNGAPPSRKGLVTLPTAQESAVVTRVVASYIKGTADAVRAAAGAPAHTTP